MIRPLSSSHAIPSKLPPSNCPHVSHSTDHPGPSTGVPFSPNVTRINQWGGYNLTYPRLAFIDGAEDPWIGATPHAPSAPRRKDTTRRPFKLIPG